VGEILPGRSLHFWLAGGEKFCRAVYFIFGSLSGEKLRDNLLHLFRRSTGFVNSALTLPARLLRLFDLSRWLDKAFTFLVW